MTLPTRPVTLSEAYAACRAFTKQRARNFYYAFAPLPKDRRNAIYAAYAFAGRGDDAVDGAGGAAERELRLRETEALLEGLGRVAGGADLVTVYLGADAPPDAEERVTRLIGEAHSGLEVEVMDGGQPHYPYILGVE